MKWAIITGTFAVSILLTGCGGGDDGPPAPTNPAPPSLTGRSYDLNQNDGGATAVSFNSASDYTFQHASGSVEAGNYNAARSGDTWTVTLQSDTGGQQIYLLDFDTRNNGSYTLQRVGEEDRHGAFSSRGTAIPNGGDPSTGSTTTGTPPPDPPGDYTGDAPVAIGGRTMLGTRTFTSTGPSGQTHTYTFSGDRFHDSDPPEESDGRFTYSANNSAATLELVYTRPTTFVGDRHRLTLNFTQRDRGNFESVYTRGDGTTIVINGVFEFE